MLVSFFTDEMSKQVSERLVILERKSNHLDGSQCVFVCFEITPGGVPFSFLNFRRLVACWNHILFENKKTPGSRSRCFVD